MTKELARRVEAHDVLFNQLMKQCGVDYHEIEVAPLEPSKSRVNYFVIFAAIVAFMASCGMTYTDVII